MTENPAQNTDQGSANNSAVTLKGLVFLLVLIAGVTALAGTSKGSHGIWSAVIGGGLALSNYMAFMWIWQRLTTATDEEAPKYMMLLTMKFMMAGAVMFLVFFALKPDAIFFLASYSALLPAMFFVTLLRG
jgi:hypothetical protein